MNSYVDILCSISDFILFWIFNSENMELTVEIRDSVLYLDIISFCINAFDDIFFSAKDSNFFSKSFLPVSNFSINL